MPSQKYSKKILAFCLLFDGNTAWTGFLTKYSEFDIFSWPFLPTLGTDTHHTHGHRDWIGERLLLRGWHWNPNWLFCVDNPLCISTMVKQILETFSTSTTLDHRVVSVMSWLNTNDLHFTSVWANFYLFSEVSCSAQTVLASRLRQSRLSTLVKLEPPGFWICVPK